MKRLVIFFSNPRPFGMDEGLIGLRLAMGGMMLLHGIGKLVDLVEGKTDFFQNFDPFGLGGTTMLTIAVISEFGCSILLMLGFFARAALVPLISTMAIAFFIFHASDDLMEKELPLIYLVGFIFLFVAGPGRYSLDYRMNDRR